MEMFNSTANHSTQSKKEFLLVFFFVLLAANPFLRQNIEMSIAVLFIYLLICFGKVPAGIALQAPGIAQIQRTDPPESTG